MEEIRLKDFKRGDTFLLYADITDFYDDPLSIDATNLTSQVRTSNNELVAELIIEAGETEGTYILSYDDTYDWPVGKLYMDIEVNNGGVRTSSPTMVIPVIRDVTNVGQ